MVVQEESIDGSRTRFITLQVARHPGFRRHFGYKAFIDIKCLGTVVGHCLEIFIATPPGGLPAPPVLVLVPITQEPVEQPRPKKFDAVDMVVVILIQLPQHIACRYGAITRLSFFKQANLSRKILLVITQLYIGRYPPYYGIG